MFALFDVLLSLPLILEKLKVVEFFSGSFMALKVFESPKKFSNLLVAIGNFFQA